MPTYDYKCIKCKIYTTKYIPMSDIDKQSCPECHRSLSQVLLSPPGVTIPLKHKACQGLNKAEEAIVPINIIDPKPDGSCRVTRIGKKTDVENL